MQPTVQFHPHCLTGPQDNPERTVGDKGHLLLFVYLTSLFSLGNDPSPTPCGSAGAARHDTTPSSHRDGHVTQVCPVSHPLFSVIGPEIGIWPKESQSEPFPDGRKMSRKSPKYEWEISRGYLLCCNPLNNLICSLSHSLQLLLHNLCLFKHLSPVTFS